MLTNSVSVSNTAAKGVNAYLTSFSSLTNVINLPKLFSSFVKS